MYETGRLVRVSVVYSTSPPSLLDSHTPLHSLLQSKLERNLVLQGLHCSHGWPLEKQAVNPLLCCVQDHSGSRTAASLAPSSSWTTCSCNGCRCRSRRNW